MAVVESSDIAASVTRLVAEGLGLRPGDVGAEDSFVQDLGADSLDLIELAMAVEESFGVAIGRGAMIYVDTVSEAAAALRMRLAA